jgi:hypothetical protein
MSTARYPPPRQERDPAGRPCWRQAADRTLVVTGLVAGLSKCLSPWHKPLAVHHLRMFTARAMTSAVVDRAIALCTAMRPFAHRGMGIVSVGENAVALVKLTYR